MTNLTNEQHEILKSRLPSSYNVDDFEAVEFNPPESIPYMDHVDDVRYAATLQDEPVTFFKKKGAKVDIDLTAKLGRNIIFCGDVSVRSRAQIGKECLFLENITLGASTIIGYHSLIGNHTNIGERCKIGHSVIINDDVEIGHRVTIGKYADIAPSIELCKNSVVENNEEVTQSLQP